MLTTNLCHFSICFLPDRQQNGNMKRSDFVEFEGRKSNKCSRHRCIFCRSSVILISLDPHIVSVALFSTSSAKNASFFLIISSGKKPQILILPILQILAKLQSSHLRHQYGIFGGKSQTSFSRNATRAGSEEGQLFSQANLLSPSSRTPSPPPLPLYMMYSLLP